MSFHYVLVQFKLHIGISVYLYRHETSHSLSKTCWSHSCS